MITLYVLGDFGVASLMRVDTLSYAIYSNWASRAHAARLALILALQAGMLLALYGLLQRDRLALGDDERPLPPLLTRATRWATPLAALISLLGFCLPLLVSLSWLRSESLTRSLGLLERPVAWRSSR